MSEENRETRWPESWAGTSEPRVPEPQLRLDRTENPKGYAVVIDDHVERFEENVHAAENFIRGIQWAGREFGWASDRLKAYGEQADSILINSTHRNVRRT
jgi:hypothetical protein